MTEILPDGWDADVLLCGGHHWITEDRTPAGVAPGDPWYVMQICDHCRAPRCDVTDAAGERCLEARHHAMLPHRTVNVRWPIGMSPRDWAQAEAGRWHL